MPSIQELRANKAPQFSYMYEVDITGANFASNDISVFAKTITIPQSAVEQTTINYKAGKTFFAGRDAASHTVSITFWDDEKQTVSRFFNKWMKAIHDPETANGTSRDNYTADLNIRLKSNDDERVSSYITLKGCFVTEIGDISLSYDNSEPEEISVTLSYETKIVEYDK